MTLKENDFVNLDYVGKTNGEIFDLTDEKLAKKEDVYDEKIEYGPVTIVLGAGHLIKGVEKAIIGKKEKDEFEVTVKPEEGFGKKNPKLLKIIPNDIFKKQKLNPRPGMSVNIDGARGRIVSVSSGRVVVDFNHPLAGKELKYEIKINKKVKDKEKQVKALLELYTHSSNYDVNVKDKKAKIKYKGEKALNQKAKDFVGKEIKKYINLEDVEFVKEENKEEKEDKKKEANEEKSEKESQNNEKSEKETKKESEKENSK